MTYLYMGSTGGFGDAYGSADKLLHIPEKPVQFLQSLNIGIQYSRPLDHYCRISFPDTLIHTKFASFKGIVFGGYNSNSNSISVCTASMSTKTTIVSN